MPDLPGRGNSPCTGANDCPAGQHIHGCYADFGSCDNPGEHWPRKDAGRLLTAYEDAKAEGSGPGVARSDLAGRVQAAPNYDWPWPPSRISGVFVCPGCFALVQYESMPAHIDWHKENTDA